MPCLVPSHLVTHDIFTPSRQRGPLDGQNEQEQNDIPPHVLNMNRLLTEGEVKLLQSAFK